MDVSSRSNFHSTGTSNSNTTRTRRPSRRRATHDTTNGEIKMYRVINVNSQEVLSLDEIDTLADAVRIADEIAADESQPEVEIQGWFDGEWVKVSH